MYWAAPLAGLAWIPPPAPEQLSRTIEALYRSESGQVLTTLVRLLGDLNLAEESMQETFGSALESWPETGIPDNPCPWLISMARFNGAQQDLVPIWNRASTTLAAINEEIGDDRLRLIFTCCHPILPPKVQVVLILRGICGVTKEKIREASIPGRRCGPSSNFAGNMYRQTLQTNCIYGTIIP